MSSPLYAQMALWIATRKRASDLQEQSETGRQPPRLTQSLSMRLSAAAPSARPHSERR